MTPRVLSKYLVSKSSKSGSSACCLWVTWLTLYRYCEAAPSEIVKPCQPEIISTIRSFLATKEKDDAEDSQDVLGELLETMRGAIGLDYSAVLNPNIQIIDLVFAIAQNGPRSHHLGSLIHEIIADMTEELFSSFVRLCSQILPFISTSLAVQPDGKEHPLMNVNSLVWKLAFALEILSNLSIL